MPNPITSQGISIQNKSSADNAQPLGNSKRSGAATSSVKNNAQLNEACSGFESLFIYMLLKEMRATIPKSGFISGGKAEEIYTSMLDSQLAKEMSSKGGLGLASIIRDQLTGSLEHPRRHNKTK